MGIMPSLQPCESKKAPRDRSTERTERPHRVRVGGARAEGTLWQRKMRTLALRLSKRRPRRDRSGAPRKRD